MCCYPIAKTVGIVDFLPKSHKNMRTKPDKHQSGLLDFTYYRFTKNWGRFLERNAPCSTALNIDSAKALNSVVGHEITHVLEGTEFYRQLQSVITEYAKSRGEYQARYDALAKLYEGIQGAELAREVTAELVGEYLFTDEQFIRRLSTENRGLFQKLFDEIKYLCRVATAGSKEARQLEKVKRVFEEVYRENAKNTAEGGVRYSIARTSNMGYGDQLRTLEAGKMPGSDSLYIGKPSAQLQRVGISDAPFAMNQSDYRKSRRKAGNNKHYSSHSVGYAFFEQMPQLLSNASMLVDNGEKTTVITSYKMVDTKGQDSFVIAGVWQNQKMENDTVNLVKSVYPLDDFCERLKRTAENGNLVIINESKAKQMLATIGVQPSEVSHIVSLAKRKLSQNAPIVNAQFSLHSDSDGKQLSKGQQEYFKDSKVRDDQGRLLKMYHGTSSGGFTAFEPYGKAKYGLFGLGSYFTDNREVAESYTKKGKGKNPQVYEVYLNVTNPMDMDAQANAAEWEKAFPDADFPESGTNEEFYRAMEEYFEDNYFVRWEAEESAMDAIVGMGYDGITHIGGGRFNKADETRHRVFITFEAEQSKNVTNTEPTNDPDINYSLSEPGAAPDRSGGYRVTGEEVRLQQAADERLIAPLPPGKGTRKGIAPVVRQNRTAGDLAPVAKKADAQKLPDNFAPVQRKTERSHPSMAAFCYRWVS